MGFEVLKTVVIQDNGIYSDAAITVKNKLYDGALLIEQDDDHIVIQDPQALIDAITELLN